MSEEGEQSNAEPETRGGGGKLTQLGSKYPFEVGQQVEILSNPIGGRVVAHGRIHALPANLSRTAIHPKALIQRTTGEIEDIPTAGSMRHMATEKSGIRCWRRVLPIAVWDVFIP